MSYIPQALRRATDTGSIGRVNNFTYTNLDDTLDTMKGVGYFNPLINTINNSAAQLQINDLIYLNGSDGSVQTKVIGLNPVTLSDSEDFTSGTHVTTWSGPWGAPLPGSILYQITENIVTLDIPVVTGAGAINAGITMDVVLPVELRPAQDFKDYTIYILNDQIFNNPASNFSDGLLELRSAGSITIWAGRSNTSAFAGTSATGTTGFPSFSISYFV